MNGLTIGGVAFASFLGANSQTPPWLDMAGKIGAAVGQYDIINFMSGYKNMSQFIFRPQKWQVGGFYFDGIIRTEHVSTIRPTEYPVQSGATFTDHAIIEPASVTLEVMMTDASSTVNGVNYAPILGVISSVLSKLGKFSNILTLAKPSLFPQLGEGRSAAAWATLKAMQLSRVPIDVETRLQTYKNMLIEEISAPDDAKTINALKVTVRLREIIIADVAEVKTAARPASTMESASGTMPVETGDGVDKTALKAGIDKGKEILGV